MSRRRLTVLAGGLSAAAAATALCVAPASAATSAAGGPGNLAQGVTSGGAGYGSNGVCGQKVGQPNIAYFQPIGEILSVYGLTLKTA